MDGDTAELCDIATGRAYFYRQGQVHWRRRHRLGAAIKRYGEWVAGVRPVDGPRQMVKWSGFVNRADPDKRITKHVMVL